MSIEIINSAVAQVLYCSETLVSSMLRFELVQAMLNLSWIYKNVTDHNLIVVHWNTTLKNKNIVHLFIIMLFL